MKFLSKPLAGGPPAATDPAASALPEAAGNGVNDEYIARAIYESIIASDEASDNMAYIGVLEDDGEATLDGQFNLIKIVRHLRKTLDIKAVPPP